MKNAILFVLFLTLTVPTFAGITVVPTNNQGIGTSMEFLGTGRTRDDAKTEAERSAGRHFAQIKATRYYIEQVTFGQNGTRVSCKVRYKVWR